MPIWRPEKSSSHEENVPLCVCMRVYVCERLTPRRNDNDVFGHMNNPYYGVLIDSIVNQYMIEECGYKVNRDVQAGIIANTYCDYFGSVSYPGLVECGLRIVKLGKASVTYEVGIFAKGAGGGDELEPVKAVGGSTHVYVLQEGGELGRPTKEGMPPHMRDGYERLVRLQRQAQEEKQKGKKRAGKL